MSPEDLAKRHPRLFHLTDPENLPGIERHGLLPTSALLTLFAYPVTERPRYERQRRPTSERIGHPAHGHAVLTDNDPLTTKALEACLDGGMSPADWLLTLNSRVFFWTSEQDAQALIGARLNRGRRRVLLVLDTRRTAERHQDAMEPSPINSGSTIRRPARRGPTTFTPLSRHDYAGWQRLRGGRDRIREVTIRGTVPDVEGLIIERRWIEPQAS